jgi:hypothetical protein
MLENERKTFIWGPPNDTTINISKFVYLIYREHGFKEQVFY